jgi:hypothetical protein
MTLLICPMMAANASRHLGRAVLVCGQSNSRRNLPRQSAAPVLHGPAGGVTSLSGGFCGRRLPAVARLVSIHNGMPTKTSNAVQMSRISSAIFMCIDYRHRGDRAWTNAPIVRPQATRETSADRIAARVFRARSARFSITACRLR